MKALALSLLVAGCATDGEAEIGFSSIVTLEVDATSTFDLDITDEAGAAIDFQAPAVIGGQVTIATGAEIVVEAIDVELADFAVEKEKPGGTLRIELADLRLHLAGPMRLDADGLARGDLVLDLSLVDGHGDAHRLAPQTIPDAEWTIQLDTASDGLLAASLASATLGPVWDFGDLEVNDLAIGVTAR